MFSVASNAKLNLKLVKLRARKIYEAPLWIS
jgi:hypothetical protein